MDLNIDPRKKDLAQLLTSSEILHVAVWVDGQYTPEEALTEGDWTGGRELLFKIEGKRGRGNP